MEVRPEALTYFCAALCPLAAKASTPHPGPMTRSRPLARSALRAFGFAKFLSPLPKRLKSPFEAERERPNRHGLRTVPTSARATRQRLTVL